MIQSRWDGPRQNPPTTSSPSRFGQNQFPELSGFRHRGKAPFGNVVHDVAADIEEKEIGRGAELLKAGPIVGGGTGRRHFDEAVVPDLNFMVAQNALVFSKQRKKNLDHDVQGDEDTESNDREDQEGDHHCLGGIQIRLQAAQVLERDQQAEKNIDAQQEGVVVNDPQPAFDQVKEADGKFDGSKRLRQNGR